MAEILRVRPNHSVESLNRRKPQTPDIEPRPGEDGIYLGPNKFKMERNEKQMAVPSFKSYFVRLCQLALFHLGTKIQQTKVH